MPQYDGATRRVRGRAGNLNVALSLPKSCVQPDAPFLASVSARKRRRKKGQAQPTRSYSLRRVSFYLDGNRVATDRKKPFRSLIQTQGLARRAHRVTARMAFRIGHQGKSRGRGKRSATKRLRANVSVC